MLNEDLFQKILFNTKSKEEINNGPKGYLIMIKYSEPINWPTMD